MIYDAYKQIHVKWVEFDGYNRFEIQEFIDDACCHAEPINNSLCITKDGYARMVLYPHDILVKHENGSMTVMKKRDFECEYTVYN